MAELSYFWDIVSSQLYDIKNAYANMRQEAKELYYESVDHWYDKANNNTELATTLSEEKISDTALMIKELENIERNLCQIDKSYERRKDADTLRTDKYKEEYDSNSLGMISSTNFSGNYYKDKIGKSIETKNDKSCYTVFTPMEKIINKKRKMSYRIKNLFGLADIYESDIDIEKEFTK